MKTKGDYLLTVVALILPLAGVLRLLGTMPWPAGDWLVALGLLISPAVALAVLWNLVAGLLAERNIKLTNYREAAAGCPSP